MRVGTGPIDYKKSGVDVKAGDDLVDWLASENPSADNASGKTSHKQESLSFYSELKNKENLLKPRIHSGIGGFAALFNARFDHIKKPLIVSCTDGVGTKVKLASYFNDYSKVGYDLVAMCANDLICTGGMPLFFLDYYATGKLNLDHAKQFLTSVRAACLESHMVLIGGETAEMPGVYQNQDFDCAGFAIGVVDEDKTWGAHSVQPGDAIIGLESSGFHSNGYSLLRKVFEGKFDQHRQWLMEPTRLYVHAALELQKQFEIKAGCHITGGGIENIPRALQNNQKAVLRKWHFPDCFDYVQKASGLTAEQMLKTLNCGMGFLFIVRDQDKNAASDRLSQLGYRNQILGHVENKTNESEDGVVIR